MEHTRFFMFLKKFKAQNPLLNLEFILTEYESVISIFVFYLKQTVIDF